MARTKKVDKKEKKTDKNVSKKSKAPKKPQENEVVVKKQKRKNESYGTYMYKVLKQIHENTGISQRAMVILNDFMNDIFERIANEASILAQRNKTRTLGSRDIMTAVRLIFVGELGKHAEAEAMQALAKYKQSYEKDAQGKSKKAAQQNVGRNQEEEEDDEENEEEEDDEEGNEEDESEEE